MAKVMSKFNVDKLKKMVEKVLPEEMADVYSTRPNEEGDPVYCNIHLQDMQSEPIDGPVITDAPAELGSLICYLLNNAHQLVEIVEAFKDSVDGVGPEMLESCTGLPLARCKEIHKTFAQLID